jgi:hypothetical protein
MSKQLSLEACRALVDMGFDQPTDMYYYTNLHGTWKGPASGVFISDYLNYTPDDEVACPDPITALRYCAGLGYQIMASLHPGRIAIYSAEHEINGVEFGADDVSELIIAIAAYEKRLIEHHRQQQAQ